MGWVATTLNYVEIVWVIACVALVQILYAATASAFAFVPKFAHEFITLVLPLLFAMTSLSGSSSIVFYGVIVTISIILFKIHSKASVAQKDPTEENIITTFRVYILLFTIVAILAVDFNIFPRHYMKTHKFGASVMDIGVGAFVAANAFASSDAKYKNLLLSVPKLLKKVFPLLVVGFIRWASTAGTGYHVDPTEYGIHWNFFMSLAIVHTVSITIIRNFARTRPGYLALIIIVTYEVALCKLDLYHLVFGPDRSTFFLANKEGILGSIGLTALYLLYVELGRILLPKIKSNESIIKDVTCLCVLFWLLVIFLHIIGIEPSRRLSNLGYIAWIAAMAMSFLFFCIVGDIARVRMRLRQPRLINDLNRTMLPVFLLANIFTGMVNFSMDTHKQSSLAAHIVLIVYLVFVSSVAWGIGRNEKLLRIVRSLFGGPSPAKKTDASLSALPF